MTTCLLLSTLFIGVCWLLHKMYNPNHACWTALDIPRNLCREQGRRNDIAIDGYMKNILLKKGTTFLAGTYRDHPLTGGLQISDCAIAQVLVGTGRRHWLSSCSRSNLENRIPVYCLKNVANYSDCVWACLPSIYAPASLPSVLCIYLMYREAVKQSDLKLIQLTKYRDV